VSGVGEPLAAAEAFELVAEPWDELAREARRLRVGRYDVAVNLRFDFWWGALLAYCAGVPRRLGYGVPEVAPFLTQSLPWPVDRAGPLPHAAQLNALLVELCVAVAQDQRQVATGGHPAGPNTTLPPLTFGEYPGDAPGLEAKLEAAGVAASGHGCIVLHPGSGGEAKLWPVAHWRRVAQHAAALGRPVVVTGSASEVALAAACVEDIAGCTVLAGTLTLGELAALLRRAWVVVGTDNGALHLAVACRARTLQVYGPSDANHFGPFGPPERHRVLRARVPCAPCGYLDMPRTPGTYKACMRSIAPEQVIAALAELSSPPGPLTSRASEREAPWHT
jgi:ADP-heptose:LPS heptosyltransferase